MWYAVGAAIMTAGSIYSSNKASDAADKASQASLQAADKQAAAEQQSLDYLKEINKLPQQYKEAALAKQAGLYGLDGGTGSQQDLINQAKASPLFQGLMGGKAAGEESIMRNQAATGGLRSGNTQQALYDYNVQLENNALLTSYNQQLAGLTGLAGNPTNEQSIANSMSSIGQTQAQGLIASGQAQANGTAQQGQIWGNTISSIGGLIGGKI